MTARIYMPARAAMQSGFANTKRQQVHLRFSTKEEAIAYCERNGIAYQLFEAKQPTRRGLSYSDNFACTPRGLEPLKSHEDRLKLAVFRPAAR